MKRALWIALLAGPLVTWMILSRPPEGGAASPIGPGASQAAPRIDHVELGLASDADHGAPTRHATPAQQASALAPRTTTSDRELLTGEQVLTGKVLDGHGAPVVGAEVLLRSGVTVQSIGWIDGERMWQMTSADQTSLRHTQAIFGGAGDPGDLRLDWSSNGLRNRGLVATTRTDARGRFRMELPEGALDTPHSIVAHHFFEHVENRPPSGGTESAGTAAASSSEASTNTGAETAWPEPDATTSPSPSGHAEADDSSFTTTQTIDSLRIHSGANLLRTDLVPVRDLTPLTLTFFDPGHLLTDVRIPKGLGDLPNAGVFLTLDGLLIERRDLSDFAAREHQAFTGLEPGRYTLRVEAGCGRWTIHEETFEVLPGAATRATPVELGAALTLYRLELVNEYGRAPDADLLTVQDALTCKTYGSVRFDDPDGHLDLVVPTDLGALRLTTYTQGSLDLTPALGVSALDAEVARHRRVTLRL